MNALWSFFWPVFGVGLLIGAMVGLNAFRQPRRTAKNRAASDQQIIRDWRLKRKLWLAGGLAGAIAAALLWCGPFGAADGFSAKVERNARQALDYYEMTKVTAHLHRGPLSRDLTLVGPADDFQHAELVRLFNQLPGVRSVSWSEGNGGVPLVAESAFLAIVGFLLGLVLAYLVELRRRYNAQWNW